MFLATNLRKVIDGDFVFIS